MTVQNKVNQNTLIKKLIYEKLDFLFSELDKLDSKINKQEVELVKTKERRK